MDQGKRKLATTLIAAASLSTAATARAVVFVEPTSDAGQTIATATPTAPPGPGGEALTSITGTIGTATDADLYILTISNTTTFSATVPGSTTIDTSLFLFTSTGAPVIANDDASGTSIEAAIPAGNALLTTLAAGTYYLGISLSQNEPVNASDQLLFTVDQPTTNVRGPASGLNPAGESDFNGNTAFAETGPYTILLTGASTFATPVPEPGANVARGLGGIASLVVLRRLRRQPQA